MSFESHNDAKYLPFSVIKAICPVCGEEFEAEEGFDEVPGCSLTCSFHCDELSGGKYVI